MKKINVFLILCFLLTTVGISSVSAQSNPTAYIPLLTADYDTSIPRQQLSRSSLQSLLPSLMEAKQKGVIKGYEPDFYGGFLKITFGPKGVPQNFMGLPTFSTLKEAAIPAPSVSNSNRVVDSVFNPHAYVSLYSSCVQLNGLVPNAHVKGTLTISGILNGFIDNYADANGYLWECFDGINTSVVPNSVVTFNIYSPHETFLKTITGTIPRISFTSLDSANSIVKGTGPAGKSFFAYWSQPDLDSDGSYSGKNITGTIPSSGAWSVDFGTTKIRGGAYIEFGTNVNSLLSVFYSITAPSLNCGLKDNRCYLYALPFKSVTITMLHGGKTYTFTGKTSYWGYFDAYLTNDYGESIDLVAGDTISGTGATTFKINSLSAVINSTADTVTGTAPANNYFYVWAGELNNGYYRQYTHSDSTGKFTADYSGWYDIPDTMVEAEVDFTSKTTGNTTWYQVMKGF